MRTETTTESVLLSGFEPVIVLQVNRGRAVLETPIRPLTEADRTRINMADIIEAQPRPIVTRDEAMSAGLTRYFTGDPCKNGHVSEWFACGKCVECNAINMANRYKKSEYRKKTLAKRATFYLANRERIRTQRSLPHALAASRARNSTEMGNLNARMSAGLKKSLGPTKNGRSWESLVGYTGEQLRTHLERQFTKGMSWRNRAKWHIDHIVPLASFRFTSPDDPEFKAAWALTNLRPLWAIRNMSKGSRREFLL